MATKAELEAELTELRAQNTALKSQEKQAEKQPEPPEESSDLHLPAQLRDVLDEHGIDVSDAEAMGNQLVDELVRLQKDHPMVVLLGVFALGCIVGRAFR